MIQDSSFLSVLSEAERASSKEAREEKRGLLKVAYKDGRSVVRVSLLGKAQCFWFHAQFCFMVDTLQKSSV